MRTKTELSTATLRKLRIVAADETPSAADAAFVENAYDDKLEEWRERDMAYWENTGRAVAEIPNVVFPTLVLLMANEVQTDFGQAQKLEDQIAREDVILRRLRRHTAMASSGEPTEVEYF